MVSRRMSRAHPAGHCMEPNYCHLPVITSAIDNQQSAAARYLGRYNPKVRAACIALCLSLVVPGDTPAAHQGRGDRLRLAVGDHFTVSFEGPQEEALAAKALESLDKAYWRIGQTLNTYPATPVAVVLYTTTEFRDITRAPAWAAAAYDGTIRVPMRGALSKGDELDRVMAHEFTHALVRTLAARGVPTWLNEGLAAALERDSIDWAEARVHRAGGLMALDRLRASFGQFGADQAELAYSTSAIAVRRLLDDGGGVAMSNLLRDLGRGEPFEAAFAHRMHRRFAAFAASMGEKP